MNGSNNVFIKFSISVYHVFKHCFNGVGLFGEALFNGEKLKERRNAAKIRKIEKLERERLDIINKRMAAREELIKQSQIKVENKEIKINKKKEEKLQKKLQAQQEYDRKLAEQEVNRNKKIKEKVVNKIDEELKEKKRQVEIEKEDLANAKTQKKLEKYRRKQIQKQKADSLKDQQKIAEKNKKLEYEEKKKRLNESYVNEDYKHVNIFNSRISELPKAIKGYFERKYNNLSIVRTIKNKRDINRQALILSFEGEDAKKSKEKLTYQYVAKNPKGKVVREYFDAYSKVEVHSFLLSEGYEVYSIKTSSLIQFLNSNISSTKIKTKDLVFFLTQLSTYIKSGVSLVDSLKILTKQYNKKNYKKIFRSLIYDLTMGDNFSQALEKQAKSFPRLLVNMVKAAEVTGDLPETLDDMARYYEESEKVRKEMITAMMYPTIIFVFALAALSFIMIYIVPKFVEVYNSMDAAAIPAITLAVLHISNFLQKYYVLIFGIIVAIILFIRLLYSVSKSFRTVFQWLVMHIPVFGNILIYNEVTMFTKTFGSLLRHNVFITDSMEILNTLTNNEIYKALILDTIANLAKGDRISAAFEDHWAFPIPAYEMIVTGEKTGQLAEMMEKVSDYYQELHSNLVVRMKTFIEPALIVFLTFIVGIIIISVVVPMFNIYSTVEIS